MNNYTDKTRRAGGVVEHQWVVRYEMYGCQSFSDILRMLASK